MTNQPKKVIVVIGSGSIAQAIARRVSIGKPILLADIKIENAKAVALTLRQAGFDVSIAHVDVSDRASVEALVETATAIGDVSGIIHTAGLSPSQATAQDILTVDLYGTAVVLETFGKVICEGGCGIVIGSQSSYRLNIDEITQAQADELATLSAEDLLNLPIVTDITDSLRAYQISKKGNALRVQAEAVNWSKRGARLNSISAGIVYTPLAYDELNSAERGEFYQNMLAKSSAKRGGTPDEIAALAEFIFNCGYMSGSDILIDGGVTASYKYGDLKPN